jgi:hypothetical protein
MEDFVRTLGIRAAPRVITFAVYDSAERAVLNIEDIKVPIAFEAPDALKYVRNNLLDVLREYEVERAGIRTTEPSAQTISIERIQIEGVIQEAFASSSLKVTTLGRSHRLRLASRSIVLISRSTSKEIWIGKLRDGVK